MNRRRSLPAALLALARVALGGLVLRPAAPARAATPVRIMPLGDSITGSPGCWRALLWNRLQNTGFASVDFVGTLGPQGCGVPYDGDNEGHGGILGTNIASQNQLIIAKILPMNPGNCAECGQRVVDLDAAIPGWASANSTAQSPITVVDQWTGFNTATDTGDGVHPNDAGIQKMSDKWYPAVVAALNGVVPSNSSPPRSSPVASSSRPSGGCSATYTPVGAWGGQYRASVTVKNTGTSTTTRWSTVLPLGSNTFQQIWGGVRGSNTGNVTITNETYNGTLAAGQTTTFGFIIDGTPPGTAPASTCTSS